MERETAAGRPFFTTLWFHAPHTPVEAGPEFLELYADYPADYAHYYGVVTAMDRAVGKLTPGPPSAVPGALPGGCAGAREACTTGESPFPPWFAGPAWSLSAGGMTFPPPPWTIFPP